MIARTEGVFPLLTRSKLRSASPFKRLRHPPAPFPQRLFRNRALRLARAHSDDISLHIRTAFCALDIEIAARGKVAKDNSHWQLGID
jgi:hypothetical protein